MRRGCGRTKATLGRASSGAAEARAARAGLVSRAMQAWQDIGWFGVRYPVYDAPWWNVPVWDTSGCCSSDIAANKFFGLMNALFGYSVRRRAP
jgi:hypothetical protein